MKIKKPWQEIFEQSPPPDLDSRVTRAAHAELMAEQVSWFSAPWVIFPVGAVATLALLLVVLQKEKAGVPEVAAAREIAEMMREQGLLRDLEVLRKSEMWERIEKETWSKAKS